jgi:hypothetical protein
MRSVGKKVWHNSLLAILLVLKKVRSQKASPKLIQSDGIETTIR